MASGEGASTVRVSSCTGNHVPVKGRMRRLVAVPTHLAVPGVCITMDASLPRARCPESSSSLIRLRYVMVLPRPCSLTWSVHVHACV